MSKFLQDNCWKAVNFEFSGDRGEPGAVYPANPDGQIGQGLVHVLPDGFQLLAVAAPRRIEHDQPHALILQGDEPKVQMVKP